MKKIIKPRRDPESRSTVRTITREELAAVGGGAMMAYVVSEIVQKPAS